MGDDEFEQGGKRRKSLESREGYQVVRPQQVQMIQPQQRRASLEALCSPSYIAKEAQKEPQSRKSIDNCTLESRRRLSRDLSRDVDKINQQLGQLLFAGRGPAATSDAAMGGSLDSRRARNPQSYNAGGRNSIGGSPSVQAQMPWQAAGGEMPSNTSPQMPWQTAGGEMPSKTATPSWMSSPEVQGGNVLPWDTAGGGNSNASAHGSGAYRRVGSAHRRTSLEALNQLTQGMQQPQGGAGVGAAHRRTSLEALNHLTQGMQQPQGGGGRSMLPSNSMGGMPGSQQGGLAMLQPGALEAAQVSTIPIEMPLDMAEVADLEDLPEPEGMGMGMGGPPSQGMVPPSAQGEMNPVKKTPWHRKIVKTLSKRSDKMRQ